MGATASIQQARLRGRLHLVRAATLAEPAVGLPQTATVADLERLQRAAAGSPLAVVLYGPDGRPAAVVDAGVAATVPPEAVAGTPLTAVSYALGPGAYVPESSQGQELLQYLAQLEGQAYAVVSADGTVIGLLRQATVLAAITGKNPRPGRRMYGRNG
jgi:CBS domain containing-hemolysin-like protein